MRYISKAFQLISILIFLIPETGISQLTTQKDSLRSRYIDAAKEIMIAAGNCALVTLDSEGRPRIRTMDPFTPDEDLTVWLGTNPKSRKVEQIKNDPRVTLYYFDKAAAGYVMIHGNALLVNDIDVKKVRWKENWNAFYPDKNENYLLIKVSPYWMEVVSYMHGIAGDSISWTPPKVYFKSVKN